MQEHHGLCHGGNVMEDTGREDDHAAGSVLGVGVGRVYGERSFDNVDGDGAGCVVRRQACARIKHEQGDGGSAVLGERDLAAAVGSGPGGAAEFLGRGFKVDGQRRDIEAIRGRRMLLGSRLHVNLFVPARKSVKPALGPAEASRLWGCHAHTRRASGPVMPLSKPFFWEKGKFRVQHETVNNRRLIVKQRRTPRKPRGGQNMPAGVPSSLW